MKQIRFTPRSRERLVFIADWTIERFGLSQAEKYQKQLVDRVAALARGDLPRGRPCEHLLEGEVTAPGLKYIREGGHYIIYRETDDLLIIVDFIHGARNLNHVLGELSDPDA